jgi:hypothetical protein
MSSSYLPENMGPVMISMRPVAKLVMVLVRPRLAVGLLDIVHGRGEEAQWISRVKS